MASYYLVTELPPLDGNNNSSAKSINNSGTVVGSSGYENKRATTWSGGTFAAPPKANALPFIEGGNSEALSINDMGLIVGTDGDQNYGHAVFWTGSEQDWVYPTDKHGYSVAVDINNSGWVAGYGNDNDHDKAYLWRLLYEEYRLGAPSSKANANANASNNNNLAVGTIADKAIVWEYHYGEHPTQHQLNGGNSSSVANDINDKDEIVGSVSNVSDKQRPVKWKNFVSNPDFLDTSFPINRGEATAINNTGEIVGWYASTQNENELRAFLSNTTFLQYYTGPNGIPIPLTIAPTMVDLNSLIDPGSGWNLKFASDINDKGQITGSGTLNGSERGFRLDPVHQILPHEFPMELPRMITTEVFKILTGLIGGNDGWILTPNGVIRVPGNRPDRSILSLLDMRVQMMIQDLLALANNHHSSYESRKRMVEKVEKFILTLHNQLKG